MNAVKYPIWVDGKLSDELPVLRARGEGQELEYIEGFPGNARDLGKEIAAFASTNTGLILLGVSDSGELIGLSNLDALEARDVFIRRLEGVCRGIVKPAITPSVTFGLENDKIILAIRVPKGTQPVYYCGNVPYIRHLTESRPAEPHEVIELVRKALGTTIESQAKPENVEYYSELAARLRDIIVFGKEVYERNLNPWIDHLMAVYGNSASELRRLAASDISTAIGMRESLYELAKACDKVAHYIHVMGRESWNAYVALVQKATQASLELKATYIDTVPISAESLRIVKQRFIEDCQKLQEINARAKETIYEGRVNELLQEVGNIGLEITQLSYHGLDRIAKDTRERLQNVAHGIHLVETERTTLGMGFVERVLEKIGGLVAELLEIKEAMSETET
jgi:ATP-dependent DNA helicase RecG